MRTSIVGRVFAGVVILILGATAAPLASAGGGTASINGTVHTIDTAKRSITIKTSVGTSVKLAVGKTAITRNGSPAALSDLTLNDNISGSYKVSRLTAKTLTASGPAVT